ncbi:uncharacterized protein LOC114406699 [Glycine soja]|uniref:uncharacterized protein LOC114406699 n=1 Tax=Glycine soja TaxID=3848 RepID=UPI00103E062A|nr:uncharacterized protein LOC114406699 [Glycine soja]
MQNSKRDVYLGAYLNGAHWQMVVILPKENLVVWFCSLHDRPSNYLKGIINIALKGLDDTPEPKSKVGARWIVVKCNRQKGSTECGYYVMHWMSTIILGTFRNNWETYFNDVRPLEAEKLKALHIQWIDDKGNREELNETEENTTPQGVQLPKLPPNKKAIDVKWVFKLKLNLGGSIARHKVKNEFEMIDLGKLAYFLGMEFVTVPSGIILDQKKYAMDVLKRFTLKLDNTSEDDELVDPTLFK